MINLEILLLNVQNTGAVKCQSTFLQLNSWAMVRMLIQRLDPRLPHKIIKNGTASFHTSYTRKVCLGLETLIDMQPVRIQEVCWQGNGTKVVRTKWF